MKERGNKQLKLLDKLVGIPLVFALGLLRLKKKLNPLVLKRQDLRIVLMKLGGFGDTILLTAGIKELRDNFPSAEITLVCTGSNAAITKSIAGLDSVVVIRFSELPSSIRKVNSNGRYDLLFDFGPWPRINSFISYMIRADFKVGFKRRKMFRHYIYDLVVEHSDHVHECENYLSLLRAVGLTINGYRPHLEASVESSRDIEQMLRGDRINVVVHPFSGGSKRMLKEWPQAHWVELCRKLIRKGCRILISGGKENFIDAQALESKIKGVGDQCTVIASRLNLDEMCAITKKADLVISVDTGIMHLASAVGANLVVLHGPTSPSRWGPLSQQAIVVRPTKECRPCLSLGFEHTCQTGGCMHTLDVHEVYRSAVNLIDKAHPPRTKKRVKLYRQCESTKSTVDLAEEMSAG